jgi:4-amino-4-deoxy-L-arabinose transferase-like glycosyltransferase
MRAPLGAVALTAIFLLALVLRSLNLATMIHDPSLFTVEDSIIYTGGAEAVLEYGGFMQGGPEGPEAVTERMPLYIMLMAGLSRLGFDAVTATVVLQAMLDSLACTLIACLGGLFDRRTGLLAGILAALWPNLVVHSAQVLTDSLFMLLMAASMLSFAHYIRRPTLAACAVLGLTVGAALMTRTAAQFAPPVLAVVLFIAARLAGISTGRALLRPALFCLLVTVVVSPILLRNATQFGTFQLTSQSGTHLLYWVVPPTLERATGIPRDQTEARLRAESERRIVEQGPDIDPFEHSRILSQLAVESLASLPVVALAKAWIVGAARTLLTPAILHDQRVRRASNGSFAATQGSLVERAVGYISSNTLAYRAWALIGLAGAALASLLQLLGVLRALRVNTPATLFGIAVLFYFLALNGPVGDAKYRLPIEPVLIVLTAHGLLLLRGAFKRRREAPTRAACL